MKECKEYNIIKNELDKWFKAGGKLQDAIKIMMNANYINIHDIENSIYYMTQGNTKSINFDVISSICRKMVMSFIREHANNIDETYYEMTDEWLVRKTIDVTYRVDDILYYGYLVGDIRRYKISPQELWDILNGYKVDERKEIRVYSMIWDIILMINT